VAQLAEIFFRIKNYRVGQAELDRLGITLEKIVKEVAIKYYTKPIEVIILLEEGTLRGKITVIGAVLAIYYFVGNYKGFKEGVSEMCSDAQKFGADVCGAFYDAAHVKEDQIVQQGVRLKTPGNLKRLIQELETLDRRWPDLNDDHKRAALLSIQRRLQQVLNDLSGGERAALTEALNFDNIPPVSEWPTRKHGPTEPLPTARIQEVVREEIEPRSIDVSSRKKKPLRFRSVIPIDPPETNFPKQTGGKPFR
jgi:hypothetical protein